MQVLAATLNQIQCQYMLLDRTRLADFGAVEAHKIGLLTAITE